MHPKVSVVIPVYNTAQYLERCITSVMQQTLKQIEIILVDDGSTDEKSGVLCDEYAKEDSRIKVIHKQNEGLGMARNSGINESTGEYIAFLDSDDYVDGTMYECLYEAVVEEQADTCLCGYRTVSKSGHIKDVPIIANKKVFTGDEIIEQVLCPMVGGLPTDENDDMINMSVWHGIYSAKLIKEREVLFCSERKFISEDIIFDLDYYPNAKKAVLLPDCFYYYCTNQVSLSRSYKIDRFDKFKILYLEEMRKAKELGKKELMQQRIYRKFLGNVRYHIQQVVSTVSRKDAKYQIKKICADEQLREVLRQYPYRYNPIKIRLFNTALGMRWSMAVWILAKGKSRGE